MIKKDNKKKEGDRNGVVRLIQDGDKSEKQINYAIKTCGNCKQDLHN